MGTSTASDARSAGLVFLIDPFPGNWLASQLATRGHTVVRAADRAMAMARLVEEDPDLVVINATDPDGGSLALTRAVRDRFEDSRPVVIASAAPLAPDHREALLRAGAWDCVTPAVRTEMESTLLRLEAYLRVHRATARERLGMLADPRTGLYNRMGLSRRARELGAQLFRSREPLACVVFEVELEPDTEVAMDTFSQVIREEGRLSDIIARWGGREVAVLATRTDLRGAIRMAERMGRSARTRLTALEGADRHVDLHAAYDAVMISNELPPQPIELVVAVSTSLRSRPRTTAEPWLRRSGGHGVLP